MLGADEVAPGMGPSTLAGTRGATTATAATIVAVPAIVGEALVLVVALVWRW